MWGISWYTRPVFILIPNSHKYLGIPLMAIAKSSDGKYFIKIYSAGRSTGFGSSYSKFLVTPTKAAFSDIVSLRLDPLVLALVFLFTLGS